MTPFSQRCIRLDDSDDEIEQLPQITIEEHHFHSSLFGHQFAVDTLQNSNFHQLLKNVDKLEIYCDAPHESFYESTSECSIDVSMEEAFHFPQKISSRLPTETTINQQISSENIKSMWCRMVSHYLEWVAGIPELRLMGVREKVKLITRQLCNIICLTASYWTYKRDHDGIMFASGIWFNPRENCDNIIRNYVTSLANVIHTHVISTFRRLKVAREEYLLLKLIVLFEPLHVQFPAADSLIVETALAKYRSALVSLVKYSHPELDHEAVMDRILALFGVLPYIEVNNLVSEMDNMQLAHMILCNNGNMQGRLTNAIHVHSSRID
ncbi:Ligand-binding domain of nuclear hormone receptor [Necator americanus]|uniref:Ligand-binding domain of nuclear hormone receptor n=1 Tax=Necator americanus TaxID=51031 RepID=W2TN89_NECAM|nr:Ligand-binding domain of nuclear hormone receptor [Necator americanus]ETN82596.1 Ligand-binding domain of nuclear hormone receptor [Necator americanus]